MVSYCHIVERCMFPAVILLDSYCYFVERYWFSVGLCGEMMVSCSHFDDRFWCPIVILQRDDGFLLPFCGEMLFSCSHFVKPCWILVIILGRDACFL